LNRTVTNVEKVPAQLYIYFTIVFAAPTPVQVSDSVLAVHLSPPFTPFLAFPSSGVACLAQGKQIPGGEALPL